MINISELITQLEGSKVMSDLMLASTPCYLLSRAETNALIKAARDGCTHENYHVFLNRAYLRFGEPSTPGYLHQYECAVIAMMVVLSKVYRKDVQRLLHLVNETGAKHGFVFAPKIASDLLASQPITFSNMSNVRQYSLVKIEHYPSTIEPSSIEVVGRKRCGYSVSTAPTTLTKVQLSNQSNIAA